MCLRMNSPATNRVGNGGCPGPSATDRTEASRQEVPIDLRRQTHQRMAKVDDLLQRWTKQIVLTIVARLAHGFSPTANLAVKGITNRQIRNPKTQENQDLPTAFLQNRILAHVKSQRWINRFRILHGRRTSNYFANAGNTGNFSMSRASCWMMTVAFRFAAIFLMRSIEATVWARS